MLPKKNRIGYFDFYLNPQKSFNFQTSYFHFRLKKSKNNDPKFVIVVPKSVDKRSTVRHKLKRIVVEMIRLRLKYLDNKNINVLIKVKKDFNKTDKKEISNEFSSFITGVK